MTQRPGSPSRHYQEAGQLDDGEEENRDGICHGSLVTDERRKELANRAADLFSNA